ncbi:uncharacterized protein LOC110882587 [Helianthus annuus]|uniref:uncharacterized protein LOC110882587 n=1 Tax=Helianthus annuus TaxID=4232 RepID=UPI000B8F2431|nr:uncharacterized protein LOC110882587 [Helianthus annuus]
MSLMLLVSLIVSDRPPRDELEWAQWATLLHLLYGVKISDVDDKWVWKSDSNNVFNVAAVKDQIMKCSGCVEDEWKYWNRWVPPKVNLFTWRCGLSRIPVKEELLKRGVAIQNSICLRCDEQVESVEHLVCKCSSSKSIWWNILAWVKVPASVVFGSCLEVLEFIEVRIGSKVWKKVLNMIFQTTIWHIWKARNEKEFNGVQLSGNMVVENIKAGSFLWLKSISKFDNLDWGRWVDFNVRDVIL